jgi:hypothetical protein
MLEKTITANNKVRANPQYPIVAGVDKDNVPQLVRTTADGRLDLGGVALPAWDRFEVAFIGATNNVATVVYRLDGNLVGTWTFTYRHGAVADDDDVISGVFTTP